MNMDIGAKHCVAVSFLLILLVCTAAAADVCVHLCLNVYIEL